MSLKINVLGGGPAGLYFAINLRTRLPNAEVIVYERNAPDDTFGWGVVFSDETLDNLREADAPSFEAITRSFATWDAIEMWTRDPQASARWQQTRSTGHGFCGISRKQLLMLLQDRARALGVTLRFGQEIPDPALLRDASLLVAADGIHSPTRTKYAAHFQPQLREGDARFVWLGTHQRFDAFTFAFEESEAGVFQAHAYQFDPHTSTFIVECDEATFAATELREDDEEATVALCQTLFSEVLGGHALLTNRSRWIRFSEVRCARWSHENIVLIGDAAHTAHFSVGSGTKMAMEDSISLASAIAAACHKGGASEGEAIQAAMGAYEEERRPLVARLQKAARQSQDFFEQTRRHIERPAPQLYFSMMSRTRRVTHENMRLRDPAYVRALDADFQARALAQSELHPAAETRAGGPLPPMFVPFQVRDLVLDNRVVVSPMCQYSAREGVPNDWHLVHLGARALGGAGLILVEMTNISAEGRITPGCLGLYTDEQEAEFSRITRFVHAHSPAKIGLQLAHAGRKAATQEPWFGNDLPLPPETSWPIVGPSALAYREGMQVPHALSEDEIEAITQQFEASARRALRCGFDLLELHLAHGYLLSSFLSPLSNLREDKFGGDLAGRARFPLDVVRRVRAIWSGPLSVRISATDWVPGGFTIEDAVTLSRWLKDAGVDLIDVSTGQTSPQQKPNYGRAFQTPFSERIRNEVKIPTITVGAIWDHDRVNTILAAGRADLVALARTHLVDPHFTARAAIELGVTLPRPVQYAAGASLAERIFPPIAAP